MTEAEARIWLGSQPFVSRETFERIERFVAFLRDEMTGQNLISESSADHVWNRHIVDSAQLLPLAAQHELDQANGWLDLGSGAGFPGLVVAMLSDWPVTLVESRSKRVDYLHRARELLGLESQVRIEGMRLERIKTAPFSVISARAFAPLPQLFALADRFSTAKTTWLLPKGRNAAKEWQGAQNEWRGDFCVKPSVTDDEAGILAGQLTGRRVDTKGRKSR